MSAGEPAVENSGSNSGVLVPQPHGGALLRGGPRPNAGRRPAAIRQKALKMLADRLDLVGHLADGVAVEFEEGGATKLVSPKPGERLQALKLLAELGLGEQVAVSEIRGRLRDQLEILRAELDPDTFTRVAARLAEVWK